MALGDFAGELTVDVEEFGEPRDIRQRRTVWSLDPVTRLWEFAKAAHVQKAASTT